MDVDLYEDPEFRALVREFVGDLEDRLAEMKTALTEGDWESLEVLSHRLKGAAGGYGFEDLSNAAARLEQCCRSGRETERAAALLEDLGTRIPTLS